MDATDSEMNIIEASGGKEETKSEANDNFAKSNDSRDLENNVSDSGQKIDERRKKFCHQYLHRQNYQEALRSLLWEPYDCRSETRSWYYGGRDENASEMQRKTFAFTSESSLSSCSSCSSLEEILTVEMTQRNASDSEKRFSLNIGLPRESKRRAISGERPEKPERKSTRTDGTNSLLSFEAKLRGGGDVDGHVDCDVDGHADFNVDGDLMFPEFGCSSDPVENLMNLEIMVTNLEEQNEGVVSCLSGRGAARESTSRGTRESGIHSETSRREGESVECGVSDEDVFSAVDSMLVAVEGTLEPRDSNEGTQLVSPDTSLDLNENPVRSAGQNRIEPGPSSGNVSVVNCYRAVPVSVVSTVPTIKCLNTFNNNFNNNINNISNVRIIQTSSGGDQKSPSAKYPPPKKFPVRPNDINNGGGAASTSRVRAKGPRDGNRNQSRHVSRTDPNGGNRASGKIERDRPKSMNVCSSEINSTESGQTLSLCENASTSFNNGTSPLSNHNRSVSNPVLGNQTKSTPNRCGSHQNLPFRSETHFGPGRTDVTDRSQTCPVQRNVPSAETRSDQGSIAAEQSAESKNVAKTSPRTFTSTEAQTDDVPLGVHPQSVINREQRRRERRERRHQRRIHQSVLNSGGSVWQSNVDVIQRDRRGLPDILNSHMPPPYSAVPVPAISAMPPPMHVPQPIPVHPVPSQTVPHLLDSPPGQPHQNGLRFLFPFPGGRRSQGQMFAHEEETPKSCCGVVVTQTVSIRWFIVMISFVGICCVIVGTVLGAMKASGREHLTVSLLMIGVGIVLVTVSVVAWRLTSQDAPSCRSMLGLGGADDSGNEPNQRFVPRMPPSYGRPHHPYAAMMYPEFQYRPPPPSYQASMQEYRLRLLLLERPNDAAAAAAGLQAAMSPPPAYRSQAGSALGLRAPTFCRSLPQSEYSHPPSYRSRTSSTRPTLDPNGEANLGSVNHSRNSSLLSHVSDQSGNVSQAVVNVISVVGNTVDLHRGDTDLQIDSIKLGVDEDVPIPPIRMLLNKGKRSPATSSEETKSENVNLVTIVTVSDNNSAPNRDHSVESDVLAHL